MYTILMTAKAASNLIEVTRKAYQTIDGRFIDSPILSRPAGTTHPCAQLSCKVETLNPLRCFKGRGALWLASTLPRGSKLVCASAGNFGMALAYAARTYGHELTVFVSTNANPLKVAAIAALGAEIARAGEDFDAAKDAAREYAETTGAAFVEDGLTPEITEGAATIGLEIEQSHIGFDCVVIPVGNGALANGVGSYLKAVGFSSRIIGVCASGAPATFNSWKQTSGVVTNSASTIADGIAVRVPIPEAVDQLRQSVDDLLLVDDEQLLDAMAWSLAELGLALEPAGASALAAILAHPEYFSGCSALSIICGATVDPALWPAVAERLREKTKGMDFSECENSQS